MKKLIFLLLFLSSFLNAEIIHDVLLLDEKNKCIYNDYYNESGFFKYRYLSSPDTLRSTTSKNYSLSLISGYQYDTDSKECKPEPWLMLGMDIKDWHFLNALVGLLFGFVFMIFTIYLFIQVGSRK